MALTLILVDVRIGRAKSSECVPMLLVAARSARARIKRYCILQNETQLGLRIPVVPLHVLGSPSGQSESPDI